MEAKKLTKDRLTRMQDKTTRLLARATSNEDIILLRSLLTDIRALMGEEVDEEAQ